MSVLNEIRERLEKLCENKTVPMGGVYYGACWADELDTWNYFVFNRKVTQKAANKVDYQTTYQINVVHEEHIPEEYVEEVIKALESNENGIVLKVTSAPIEYNYTFKGKTDMVVEIATIEMFRPEKRH